MSFTKTAYLTPHADTYTLHGPLGSLVLTVERDVTLATLAIHRRIGERIPDAPSCPIFRETGRDGPCWQDDATHYATSILAPLAATRDEEEVWSALEVEYCRLIEHQARD